MPDAPTPSESEERFRTIIEALPHIAFIVRPDGIALYYNDRCRDYFGDMAGDTPGRLTLVHPDDRAAVVAAREAAVLASRAFEIDLRLYRHDGACRWHRFRSVPLFRAGTVDGGALEAYVCSAIDIHELRQANELLEQRVKERTAQLVASQTQIQLLYDHSTECHSVIVAREDGRFVFEEANPAVLRLYGMGREAVIGRSLEEVFEADAAAEIRQHLGECLRGNGPYRYERVHGQALIEAVAVPVPRESGGPRRLVVTARDTTEARRLEAQLRQAQKMEAIGQLTGGIAHDFNNLLTVMIGNLDLLQRRLGDTELGRLAAAARRGADRATTLTHRLLAFSRKQPLEPREIDLNRVIGSMSVILRRSLGEAITIETVLAAGLWPTVADPNQVENALLNLAINARDAMPNGGKLTIETANAECDEAYARDNPDAAIGQYVSLAVSDTGAGMAPEVLARAIEPFFTTKEIGSGSGLGLSMIYGFVKQSGGHLRIISAPGRGTTVKIHLPRRHSRRGRAEDA